PSTVLTNTVPDPTLPVNVPITATITISTGLNARSAPAINATVVTLLPNGARYRAISRSEDNQWVQVRLVDGSAAWVFAQYVSLDGAISSLPLASPAGSATITGTLVPTTTVTLTGTRPITAPTTAGDNVSATVSSLSGARARTLPDRTAPELGIFPFEAVLLPVQGRSADNEWVQIEIEPGQLAWMLTSAVRISVDLATLPVVTP
ncbi:MAG: SH3 domain-containing protein, partial [Chloroflexota bacterium]|nr:SH3 domain-containing protein [Chloroflexota bacterium]